MTRARRNIDPDLEHIPTPEEEAELEAALTEADLGGGIPLEQFMRELRQVREKLERRPR